MLRRRRSTREIPFSFDSFLDVVANVVGIIIRLILVVWVGARSYSGIQMLAKPKAKPEAAASITLPADPLEVELVQQRQELAQLQAKLLEQLRQVDQIKASHQQVQGRLADMITFEQSVDEQARGADQSKSKEAQTVRAAELSLEEVRRRREKLLQEIRTMEKLPALKQMLRYRTPISKPVTTEEYFFECRNGRVTFLDIGTMLEEVSRAMNGKAQTLRNRWQVSDVTAPIGPFRLRYTVERQRGTLDSIIDGGPAGGGNFQYGVSEWVLEPVIAERGETWADAMADGSQFRQVGDSLDASAAVTFWVYPDSFGLYRKLRDYLYERDVVVAGRPLTHDAAIAASRSGSISRGQ